MGISGPTPNAALDLRERKYGWTTLPNTATATPPPPLVGEHTDRGLDQWARWWATPMAAMWAPYDADALERLLDYYEAHWARAEDRVPPSEMRQMEDRFGLTPSARRRLYWQIEGVDIPAKTPDRLGHDTGGTGLPAAGGEGDPRLRVVAGGKVKGKQAG